MENKFKRSNFEITMILISLNKFNCNFLCVLKKQKINFRNRYFLGNAHSFLEINKIK